MRIQGSRCEEGTPRSCKNPGQPHPNAEKRIGVRSTMGVHDGDISNSLVGASVKDRRLLTLFSKPSFRQIDVRFGEC